MAEAESATTSTCSSLSGQKRLGSASPSTSVICEEVFDETCQPSAEEINDYALLLGINPIKEPHLLHLAKEGLMQALPPQWKICYSEEKCGHYYYNTKTKQSQWDHPLDAVYRDFVAQARLQHVQKSVITPIVENSDDASQLDSGIRSLQGCDDYDNTNNTNDMSSPGTNSNGYAKQNVTVATQSSKGVNPNGITSTSGFSGTVSRFLESRSKNFGPIFMPLKNTRFEVAKASTNLGIKPIQFGQDASGEIKASELLPTAINSKQTDHVDQSKEKEKKGFSLSGSGAMFLKSRRQIELGLNQATAMLTNSNGYNAGALNHVVIEAGTPPSVKGILRDSSLTDMRRRVEIDESDSFGAVGGCMSHEDKKSVRFNLEETKIRSSPEEDITSSRKLTQSPEISANSDDEPDDVGDDLWDEDDVQNDEDEEEGAVGYQHSLNPFLMQDQTQLNAIKVIAVPKAQTIQMLKAQSFSMDLPEHDRAKPITIARAQSVDIRTEQNKVQTLSCENNSIENAVTYLDKLKDTTIAVKPLYEDTDSDSKASSVRSFIINKSEQDSLHSLGPTNPFDLEELGRKHSRDVEQLEKKLQLSSKNQRSTSRPFRVASKVVNLLVKDSQPNTSNINIKDEENNMESVDLPKNSEQEKQALLNIERERLEELLQKEIDIIKHEHEGKLKNIRHEYNLRLTSHQHQLEEAFDLQLEEYRVHLEEELEAKRNQIVDAHKAHMANLQQNHAEILEDLERDLKSEEEILRKEHDKKLKEMRDQLTHELENERQRMRESGEDRLYEKVRCEKRLLEDKYRCLKEKYVRLKTDVKLSLERRNRRREAQALHQQSLHTTTTGSETERSLSNKPSIGNSENRSLSFSTSCQDQTPNMNVGNGMGASLKSNKPPVPPKTHLTTGTTKSLNNKDAITAHERDRSPARTHSISQNSRKTAIASKYIKHLQVQDDTTTSLSQSDTTISNNYTKGRYLPMPSVVSDNGNSDSEALNECNQENNNNSRGNTHQRKKVFSRTKSASTSRLNSENYKCDRPCTPVENLRHQLQKLEDLEDQFPDNTLEATYHLRYPFTDISNEHGAAIGINSGTTHSELEFFKHRIHLERDSVRRAKDSLRTQRTNFRARQREIKQRHKASITRHTLDQLIQEEKELTEMEVNLHRTRALLGEKVIRLRHLEQSLLRIYEKEKPHIDMLGVEHKIDDTTLSDLSSHSSSGFSSTDFASGADTHNKRKELYQQESSECIQNLEILNAEIREILDILGQKQQNQNQQQQSAGLGLTMLSPSDLNWTHMLGVGGNTMSNSMSLSGASNVQCSSATAPLMHAPQSIPTLADRLETYRQLAAGRMQTSMGGAILAANTIVSQSPRAVNYTTSLVERTRDLRNWLRQAKHEHDLLTGMTSAHQGLSLTGGSTVNMIGSGAAGTTANTASGSGCSSNGVTLNSTQANL